MTQALRTPEALYEPPALAGIDPLPPDQLFDGQTRSEKGFGGDLGLRRGPSLTSSEIARLRELVKQRLVYNARNLVPSAARALELVEIEQYHDVSDRYDHSKMLCKTGRILSADAVREIKDMSLFAYLREAFGDFHLADEDNIGHEQVCMRVVRPNRREDVGSLHRDSWFWDYYKWPVPTGYHRTKVWLGICVDPDRSGLLLAPGSHRRPAPYEIAMQGPKVAFVPKFNIESIGLRRYTGKAGDPILFNYDLLHVGSLNRSSESRASIEFTILFS